MIRNIIFDFGAVLLHIDESRTWDAFEKMGVKPELRKEKEIFHAYEKGEISSEDFLKRINPFFFRKMISTDLASAWNAILDPLSEDVIPFLKDLEKENYRLFLLSNTNDLHIRHVRQVAGPFLYSQFIRRFEKVYYSFEMGMRKPDREIFEKVIEDSELKPEETFYIDDGLKHTQTAKKLGIHTWHFKPREHDITDVKKKIAEAES